MSFCPQTLQTSSLFYLTQFYFWVIEASGAPWFENESVTWCQAEKEARLCQRRRNWATREQSKVQRPNLRMPWSWALKAPNTARAKWKKRQPEPSATRQNSKMMAKCCGPSLELPQRKYLFPYEEEAATAPDSRSYSKQTTGHNTEPSSKARILWG